MPSYLYAVQDHHGREVVSAHVDVEKVTDVTAHKDPEYDAVELRFENLVIDSGAYEGANKDLFFLRVPSDDKLAQPVKHPVR